MIRNNKRIIIIVFVVIALVSCIIVIIPAMLDKYFGYDTYSIENNVDINENNYGKYKEYSANNVTIVPAFECLGENEIKIELLSYSDVPCNVYIQNIVVEDTNGKVLFENKDCVMLHTHNLENSSSCFDCYTYEIVTLGRNILNENNYINVDVVASTSKYAKDDQKALKYTLNITKKRYIDTP